MPPMPMDSPTIVGNRTGYDEDADNKSTDMLRCGGDDNPEVHSESLRHWLAQVTTGSTHGATPTRMNHRRST